MPLCYVLSICSDTPQCLNPIFYWPGVGESCSINLLPFSGQFLLAPGPRSHSGCHSGSCQREIASKQDEFAPCRQCRAKILLAPLWGNVKDKGAVPSGCLLSERRCNVVVTKAGEEGTNLCEGKVWKLEVRRDKPAFRGVSGFEAAPRLEPACQPSIVEIKFHSLSRPGTEDCWWCTLLRAESQTWRSREASAAPGRSWGLQEWDSAHTSPAVRGGMNPRPFLGSWRAPGQPINSGMLWDAGADPNVLLL